MRKPLAIWGPPGSGKSTVGAIVARLIGWDFLDLDAEISRRAGLSIDQLFAQGEPAFRAVEREVLRESLAPGRVLSLGGGALLDETLRREVLNRAEVVRLDASVERLSARLAPEAHRRPLLAQGDLSSTLSALLEARRAAYKEVSRVVETSELTPDEAARALLRLVFPAEKSTVTLGSVTHPFALGPGLLDRVGSMLREVGAKGRVFVLADARVARKYGRQVLASLRGAGFSAEELALPAGEGAKEPRRLLWMLRQLGRVGADRGDFVVALGGGAALDAAGMAAALYMRGLPLVMVPTTALAMLDASLGGKVAVNEDHAKNLYGTFYPPALVLSDTTTLSTLPRRELRAASAEAVKSALLGDAGLLDLLERETARLGLSKEQPKADLALWGEVIARSARVKIGIVGRDFLEKGERKLLNLGHTLGHALEKAAPRLRHGEAVALGLRGALWLSQQRQQAAPAFVERVNALLDALGLPKKAPKVKPHAVRAALALDKKRDAGTLTFLLPIAPEKTELRQDVTEGEMFAALSFLGVEGVEKATHKPKVKRLFRKPKRRQEKSAKKAGDDD